MSGGSVRVLTRPDAPEDAGVRLGLETTLLVSTTAEPAAEHKLPGEHIAKLLRVTRCERAASLDLRQSAPLFIGF